MNHKRLTSPPTLADLSLRYGFPSQSIPEKASKKGIPHTHCTRNTLFG